MPDTRKPLGQTIVDGLAGLIYDDPITLWGSGLAVLATWLLLESGLLADAWVGPVLAVSVWAAIGVSLARAVSRHNKS